MMNALHLLRKLFIRRKHQRFFVRRGTVVVVVTPGKLGQEEQRRVHVIDISMGGAAFIYAGSPNDIDDTGFIKLRSAESLIDEKVHFETISDILIPDCMDSVVTLRRRGIRFTWMGVPGENLLKDFIKDNGLFPKPRE